MASAAQIMGAADGIGRTTHHDPDEMDIVRGIQHNV